MKRRRDLAALTFAVGILVAPVSAECCSCVSTRPITVERFLEEATAVFSGRVVSIETQVEPQYTGGFKTEVEAAMSAPSGPVTRAIATFAVTAVWKGEHKGEQKVVFWYAKDGALCDYVFKADTDYVVFGYGSPLTASICDFTAPIAKATDTLRKLKNPAWKPAP